MRLNKVILILFLVSISFSVSVKWQYTTSQTYARPVIDGESVYVATADGKVHAFTLDGARKWAVDVGSPILSSPVVMNFIYVPAANGIYAFDREGKARGSISTADAVLTLLKYESYVVAITKAGALYLMDTTKDLSEKSILSTISLPNSTDSSSVSYGGKLYVGLFDGRIFAVDPLTGYNKSIAKIGPISRAEPIAAEEMLLFGSERKIHAVSSTGKELWSAELPAWHSPPTYNDGKIFVGTNDGKLYVLNMSGDILWSFSTEDAIREKPVVIGQTVYVSSHDKKIYVIDINTTKERWNVALDDWPTTASYKDGLLFTVTFNGTVYAISTLGCEILQPEENATVFSISPYSGIAYADSGLDGIEVRVVGLDWKNASIKENEWSLIYTITGQPEGEVNVQCRARDKEGNFEREPYASKIYNYVADVEKLPKIVILCEENGQIVNCLEKVTEGTKIKLIFQDEKKRQITGLGVTADTVTYGDLGRGYVELKIPLKTINITATKQNYRSATITITGERSTFGMALTAAAILLALLLVFYLWIRWKKWR